MLPKRSKAQVNLAPKSSDFRAGTVTKTENLFDQKHQQEMEYVPVLGVIQERPPNQVATVVHMYCIYIPEKGGDESQPPNKCSGGVFSLRFMLCALHLRAVHHRDQFFAAGSVPISIDLLLAYPTMARFPHCLEKNSGPKQLSHSTALFDYSATSLKPNASRGKI